MSHLQGLYAPLARYTWPQRLTLLLVMLFPVLNIAVKDGGSTVYTLLVLPALFLAWSEWPRLTAGEKRWLLGYVVLFALAAFSLSYSAELDTGVKKLERYFRLATLGPIYLLLRRMQLELGQYFFLGVAIAILIMGGQALYEVKVLGSHLSVGPYHKIVFGDMAVLNLAIIAAAMLTLARRPWHYLLLAGLMAVAVYASLMSYTRAAWLFIPVLAVFLLLLYRRHFGRRAMAITAVVMLLAALALTVWTPQRLQRGIEWGVQDIQAFIENPGTNSSWGSRLNMWRNSVIIWADNPVLGTGIGDFNHDSRRLVEEGVSYSEHILQYGHAHSIYFDALATLGAVGLLLLVVALIVLPALHFYRYWLASTQPWARFFALSGLLTVFAFAFFGLTEGWLSRNPFVNPYILYIATCAAGLVRRDATPVTEPEQMSTTNSA